MTRAYGFLLRLYPPRHRAIFGEEMQSVFSEAAEEHRARGLLAYGGFLLGELAGLLLGSGKQWLAPADANTEAPLLEGAEAAVPIEIRQVRLQIAKNLRLMEHAIANHQFPKARFYSEADRHMRKHLQLLCQEHGIDDSDPG